MVSVGCRLPHRTVKVYLAGIQFSSMARGYAESLHPMRRLGCLVAGIRRRHCGRGSRTRDPILIRHMRMLFAPFDRYCCHPDALMLRAAVSFAFFGLLRCSTYTFLSRFGWDPEVHLRSGGVSFGMGGRVTVQVTASKTDPIREGCQIRLVQIASVFCPVAALRSYCRASGITGGPLFQHSDGSYLTRGTLSGILRSCFRRELNLKTHSFRIGGASAAAAAGVPYYVIQKLGRWKSAAFKMYIKLSDDYVDDAYTALVETFR